MTSQQECLEQPTANQSTEFQMRTGKCLSSVSLTVCLTVCVVLFLNPNNKDLEEKGFLQRFFFFLVFARKLQTKNIVIKGRKSNFFVIDKTLTYIVLHQNHPIKRSLQSAPGLAFSEWHKRDYKLLISLYWSSFKCG